MSHYTNTNNPIDFPKSVMRYFSHNEYDQSGGRIITLSEDEIKDKYWPYWYNKMCAKYGKDHVDANYTWQDCLEDWVVVNWAWITENE